MGQQRIIPIAEKDSGDFAHEKLAWDVLRAVATCDDPASVAFDLTKTKHLKPYAIACLAALGEQGARLIPPTDSGCLKHLMRLGMGGYFTTCNIKSTETRSTNVPVRRLEDRDSTFSEEAMSVWDKEFKSLPLGLASELATHLDEVINNAVTHAESPVGAIVCGQAFPENGLLDLCVVDLGQTIPTHLRSNPANAPRLAGRNDAEALVIATEEGVTGTRFKNRFGEPNSGIGLHALRTFCEAGHGELTILSRNNYVLFRQGELPMTAQFYGGFPGSLVNVRFFCKKPLTSQILGAKFDL